MKKKAKSSKSIKCKSKFNDACNGGGGIYCLGFLGAVIYYISTATGFWHGVLGVLKALIWPVFLLYKVLAFIGA